MGVPPVKDTRPRPSPTPESPPTPPVNPFNTPLKKKSKKILGTAKISATFLIVLGGTTARCSNRCSGL
jgi:hypothetical protein